MAKIFVSYSNGDKQTCTELAQELSEQGHEVWVDRESIPGGTNYFTAIESGIRDADVFLLLLSKKVVSKPEFICDEVQLAEAEKKRIIPVRIDESSELPLGLQLSLQNHQYIQLWRNHRRGLQRLLEELQPEYEPEAKLASILVVRGRRGFRRVRTTLRQNEVGKRALKVAGAVAVGAVAIGAAAAGGAHAQEKTDLRKADEQERSNTEQYRERVRSVLSDCETEFNLATEMSPSQYTDAFRPRIQNLLGQLSGIHPPDALHREHEQLVSRLDAAVEEFDKTMKSFAAEDYESAQLGLLMLQQRWLDACRALGAWEG